MSFTSELADRLPSGGERTRTRMVAVLAIMFVLLPAITGVVAANEHTTNTDFLCGDNSNTSFSNTMKNLMTVFVVAGPVIGTLVAAYAQVAMAGDPNNSKWAETRKKALVSGWSVPIMVYMTEIMASSILGIKMDCIVP